MGKKDSIDYDNLTYGDILSTIKKLGINMCNDEKLLKHQLKNKKKAKYEMGNFCEQYGLPLITHSRQKDKKHDKIHKSYNHKKYKKYKTNLVKPNDFYAKKKNVSKRYDKQRSSKGKCFNCGKPGHFSKDCKQKPVLLCSLSLYLCLPETLILLCCVPFLPSLPSPSVPCPHLVLEPSFSG